MAVSSAHVENVQHSIESLSGTVSSAMESLASSMASSMPSTAALVNGTTMEHMEVQSYWAWSFARMIMFLIKVFPGILFWIITFTTITLPTFLFTLLSTSLTVTMNATTLYVFTPCMLYCC
jgi:lysophospholipid hydrolase